MLVSLLLQGLRTVMQAVEEQHLRKQVRTQVCTAIATQDIEKADRGKHQHTNMVRAAVVLGGGAA